MQAQVRLGQQHRGGESRWVGAGGCKRVKEPGYRLQARRMDGLQALLTHPFRIDQPESFAAAVMKIGGEVQSVHKQALKHRTGANPATFPQTRGKPVAPVK